MKKNKNEPPMLVNVAKLSELMYGNRWTMRACQASRQQKELLRNCNYAIYEIVKIFQNENK